MKLDEFISNVLNDIHNGLHTAYENTGKKYSIGVAESNGVSFDIAVTTKNASGKQAEGTARAGFVEVLGADVGAKIENRSEKNQVSRIQFTVYVPSQTEIERQSEIEARNIRRDTGNDWGL